MQADSNRFLTASAVTVPITTRGSPFRLRTTISSVNIPEYITTPMMLAVENTFNIGNDGGFN
jgi:hypothetical protein